MFSANPLLGAQVCTPFQHRTGLVEISLFFAQLLDDDLSRKNPAMNRVLR
jgi:hypothetical protein